MKQNEKEREHERMMEREKQRYTHRATLEQQKHENIIKEITLMKKYGVIFQTRR